MSNILFRGCCSEKSADSPVCLAQFIFFFLEDASQQMSPLFLVLHLSLLLLLFPSSPFTLRPAFLLSALVHFHPSLMRSLSSAATPCSSSCLSWTTQARIHHWLPSISPASAPFVSWSVTVSASCLLCSSQQQKLPPTQWIIHESVSVFKFDWRKPSPDLSPSPRGAALLDSSRECDQLAGLQVILVRLL